jgi:hypothetical protein
MIAYSDKVQNLGVLVHRAFLATSESWGGYTIHWASFRSVAQKCDAYAVTVKDIGEETISIPADADYDIFEHAFMKACANFDASYLGIFHDDVKGTIDFDPVVVVATTAEVDQLAIDHNVVGGAYHFATGNGYWPQGRPVTYAA